MDLTLVLKILKVSINFSNDLEILEMLGNEFWHQGSQPLAETFYNKKLGVVSSYQNLVLIKGSAAENMKTCCSTRGI